MKNQQPRNVGSARDAGNLTNRLKTFFSATVSLPIIIRRCLVAIPFAILPHLEIPHGWATDIRTVVVSGDFAADLPVGVSFVGFGTPTLDSLGQVAFHGFVAGNNVGDSNDHGIWSEGSGSLALVAREGDPAPGTAIGVTYADFVSPVLTSSGMNTFKAKLNGADVNASNDFGIWSDASGILELVARTGDQVPIITGDVSFGLLRSVVQNNAGEIAFAGQLVGSDVNATNDVGLWSHEVGSLNLIAREGNEAPDTGGDLTFGSISAYVGLNSSGHVAFKAFLDGVGVDGTNRQGLWAGNPSNLKLILREGDPAPGIGGDARFSGLFVPPAFDSDGQVAFHGRITGNGIDHTNDDGVWIENSGTIELLAQEGDAITGTPGGLIFDSIGSPVLSSSGDIVFNAAVEGIGVDSANDDAIWTERNGSLKLVMREGNLAPGTADGAIFDHMASSSGPVINSRGQIAFEAFLSGPNVDASNDGAIWAQDVDDDLQLIAREGDLLEVSPGDLRVINNLSFLSKHDLGRGTGDDDGAPNGFNNLGQLAFKADFANGTAGIFVSSIVATPIGISGDFDDDGDVDGADFLMWQHNTNVGDLSNWETNFGNSSDTLSLPLSVPEPSLMTLLALSIIILESGRSMHSNLWRVAQLARLIS